MTTVATAYVKIVPNMQGAAKSIHDGIVGTAANAGATAGKKAGKSFSSGFSVVKVALGNIIASGFSNVTGKLSSALSDAVTRVDELTMFPKVMESMGISTEQSNAAVNKLSERLQGLPTAIDDATASVKRFTSKNNDVGKSTDYFLALNDALVSGGASSEIQSTAIEQLAQAYAKGKPDMVEWKSLMTAMPAQLNQVAEYMGYGANNANALGEDLRNSRVSMDDFMDALVTLDTDGGGMFTSFAESAQNASGGIRTALTNLGTSVVRGLANIVTGTDEYAGIGVDNIKGFILGIRDMVDDFFAWANPKFIGAFNSLSNGISSVKPHFEALAPVVTSVANAVAALLGKMMELASFLMSNPWAAGIAGAALFAGKITGLWSALGTLGKALVGTGTKAVKGLFGKIKKHIPTFKFGQKASDKLAKSVKNLAPASSKSGKALTKLGKGAKTAGKSMGKLSGFTVVAAAILMISASVALLAYSARSLAESGGGAIAVFFGMIVAVAAVVAIFALFGTRLTAAKAGILAVGIAISAMMLSMSVLAVAATALANTGGVGIAVIAILMVGLVAIIAVVALFGAGLNAAIPGILALGVALAAINLTLAALALAITPIVQIISDVTAFIISRLPEILYQIQGIIQSVGGVITGVLDAIFNGICNIINSISGAFVDGINALALAVEPIGTHGFAAAGAILALAAALTTMAAGSFLDFLTNAPGNLQAIGNACQSISGSGYQAAGAMNAVSGSFGTLKGTVEGGSASITDALNTLPGTASNAMWGMYDAINGANIAAAANNQAEQVKNAFNWMAYDLYNIGLNAGQALSNGMQDGMDSIKTPHFDFTTETKDFNGQKVTIPKDITVEWYKSGGIFDRPSVIGVGEAGSEAVVPLTAQGLRPLAAALAEAGGTGGQTNVYIDGAKVNDDPAIKEAFMNLMYTMNRKKAMA